MMSHFHINTNIDSLLVEFNRFLSENKVGLSSPIENKNILNFEQIYNIRISNDFRKYLFTGNGFSTGEIFGLANLWPLERFCRITDFFKFNTLTSDINEAIEKKLSFNTTDSNEKKIVDEKLNWQLNDPNTYFVFGDYNINSCYWAIKLTNDNNEEEVICINDWGNTYTIVANNFLQFLSIFVREGAEALI